MDCSTPGFPVRHHLPKLAQIHVHWVSDANQPSRPLSSPSPPAFSLNSFFITCKMDRQRLLNLSWHYWDWSQETPHREGVLCVAIVSTPDLHPPGASSFPPSIVTTKNVSPHCQTSRGEQNRSSWVTSGLKLCWTLSHCSKLQRSWKLLMNPDFIKGGKFS